MGRLSLLLGAVLCRRVKHRPASLPPARVDVDLIASEPITEGRRVFMFVDFEDVLADSRGLAQFFHAPQIDQLLRRFPSVRVVLTTSERLYLPLEQLVKPFAPDVRSRFVGVTPSARHLWRDDGCSERELECLAWLRANNAESDAWIAVGAVEAYFLSQRDHLHLVGNEGLDRDSAEQLAKRLVALMA